MDSSLTNEKKNIRWGIAITYIRLFASIALGLLYPPYLLEKVGSSANGVYIFAGSIFAYILLLSFGIENSYVRFATLHEKEQGVDGLKKVNTFYFTSFVFLALTMLVSGLFVAFLYQGGVLTYENETPEGKDLLFKLLLIVTIGGSLDFILSLFTWYVYYKSKFIFEQLLYLAIHIFTILGSFLFLYFGFDIVWVCLITWLITLFFDVIGMIYALKKLKMPFGPLTKQDYWPMAKEVLSFSVYIFLMILVSQINNNLGKISLGQMVGMGVVTVFTYGFQFYVYENQIAIAISQTFTPKVNRLAVDNNQEALSSLFLKVSVLQLLVLFLIVGGFASCGMDFINAWLIKSDLSTNDKQAIYYLSLSFLLLWIIPLSQYLGIDIQRALNKHKVLSLVNLGCALASILITILCIVFLPTDYKVYGPLIGMAAGVVVGMIVVSDVYYVKALKLPIGSYYFHFMTIGMIAVLAYVVVYVVYTYAIHLPQDMNGWVMALIKGASFVVLYVPVILTVYHKSIKSLKTNDDNEN